MFGHNYDKYKDPFRAHGFVWYQKRVCKDCGWVDIRRVGTIIEYELGPSNK